MSLLNHDQIKNKNKKTLTRGPKIEINNQVSRIDIDKDNFTKEPPKKEKSACAKEDPAQADCDLSQNYSSTIASTGH